MQSARNKLLCEGGISIHVAIGNAKNKQDYLIFQEDNNSKKYPIDKTLAEHLIGASSLTIPLLFFVISHQCSQTLDSDLLIWRLKLLQIHVKNLSQAIELQTQTPTCNSVKPHEDQADLINGLPTEVLFLILRYLPMSDVNHAVLVCHRWYAVMRDNSLWRTRLASLPYVDDEKIANASQAESYFYIQFLNSLKNKFRYSPEIKDLIKPAIDGDLHALLTKFAIICQGERDESKPFTINTISHFTFWLQEENKGEVIFYILCVFQHQHILDLFFESKLFEMIDTLGVVVPIKSVMQLATKYNQMDKLKWLIKIHGEIPLFLLNLATKYNHLDILIMLLKMLKKDVKQIKAGLFNGSLNSACKSGHVKAVKLFLGSGFKEETDKAFSENMPLQLAVQNGHLDVIRLLIEYGVNINLKPGDGAFLLKVAMQNGHYNMFVLLLEKGANIEEKIQETTIWHLAVAHPDLSYAQVLLKYGAAFDKRSLFSLVNTTNQRGELPLHLCCHPSITKMLIEMGSDINCKDAELNTPLHAAVKRGNAKVVEMLISQHANLMQKNKKAETASDCIKYIKELKISKSEKTAIQQEMRKMLSEAENRNQLYWQALIHRSQETNMQKIEALCQYYIEKNKFISIFTNPVESYMCKKIIELIRKNNLTTLTFYECCHHRWSVKPEIGLFHTMLNMIGELLEEKKEIQQDLVLNMEFPDDEINEKEKESERLGMTA